jgi:putative copper export protein
VPIETDAGSVADLIWLARTGVYLGLFAGVGGVFFSAWIGRARTASNVIAVALAVGLISAAASLGLQGLDLPNLTLVDMVTPAPWKAASATSLGPSLLIAIAAMAAASLPSGAFPSGLVGPWRPWRWLESASRWRRPVMPPRRPHRG